MTRWEENREWPLWNKFSRVCELTLKEEPKSRIDQQNSPERPLQSGCTSSAYPLSQRAEPCRAAINRSSTFFVAHKTFHWTFGSLLLSALLAFFSCSSISASSSCHSPSPFWGLKNGTSSKLKRYITSSRQTDVPQVPPRKTFCWRSAIFTDWAQNLTTGWKYCCIVNDICPTKLFGSRHKFVWYEFDTLTDWYIGNMPNMLVQAISENCRSS